MIISSRFAFVAVHSRRSLSDRMLMQICIIRSHSDRREGRAWFDLNKPTVSMKIRRSDEALQADRIWAARGGAARAALARPLCAVARSGPARELAQQVPRIDPAR